MNVQISQQSGPSHINSQSVGRMLFETRSTESGSFILEIFPTNSKGKKLGCIGKGRRIRPVLSFVISKDETRDMAAQAHRLGFHFADIDQGKF